MTDNNSLSKVGFYLLPTTNSSNRSIKSTNEEKGARRPKKYPTHGTIIAANKTTQENQNPRNPGPHTRFYFVH